MSARTDSYPLKGPADLLARMVGCDQVHPSQARQALAHDLLVFGLCPDKKWRRVKRITVHKPSYTAPTVYCIAFVEPVNYVRNFSKDGILLVEVPPSSDSPIPTPDSTGG